MLSPQQEKNLAVAAPSAIVTEHKYKLPALLSLAQWAEESGWGNHAPGNNCFGIKSYHGCSGTQSLITHEYIDGVLTPISQVFASFPTLDGCFAYHAILITQGHPYKSAWMKFTSTHDPEQLVKDIAPDYAPNNLGYANTIIGHMRDSRIIHALQIATAQFALEKTS